jgi:hypothetical protein
LEILFICITSCIIVLIPAVRSAIIVLGENLAHEQINHRYWDHWLLVSATTGLFGCVILVFIVLQKYLATHAIITTINQYLNNHITLIITLFSVLMSINFLFFLNLPVGQTGLDPSWEWALNNLVYKHFIFGKDVTFNYGPLGYLLVVQHFGKNIIQGIALNVFCIIFILFLFYIDCKKSSIPFKKIFIFNLWLFIFSGSVSFEWIWNIMLLLLFITCYIFRKDKYIWLSLVIYAALISAFSLLLKFNTSVFAVALACVLGLCLLFYERKRQFINYICLFSIVYIIFTIIGIMVFFKNIDNFTLWLKMSLEIAGGYSSAMVITRSFTCLFIALILITLYLIFVFVQRKETDHFALCILGIVVVFFSFKHGFVRQDGHMLSFFATIPFLTGFLFLFSSEGSYKKSLVVFRTAAILCFLGIINYFGPIFVVKNAFENIYNITQLKKNYQTFHDRKVESMKQNVLPNEWNTEIGSGAVQILPWELSYAEANHWIGWQPNPGLQLFNVYTKRLDEYSALSFAAEKAPPFILLEYKSIDGRNMFLDTPATWNTIFPNYKIAKQDTKRILLSKKDVHSSLHFVSVGFDNYKFNETILVPESSEPIYAKIFIENSFLGKIITILYHGNPSEITVVYQNGDERQYRIIENTLRNPVLINYIPTNFDQTCCFFSFEETREENLDPFAVKEIKFSNEVPVLYKKDITIEWFHSARW